jgi:formylglycine-generating enzyme
MLRSFIRLIAVAPIVLALSGCGGCGGEVQHVPVTQTPPEEPRRTARPVPAQPPRAAQKPTPKREARPDRGKSDFPIDPSVDPNDVFEIVAEPEGFELLEPGPRESDRFAVVLPRGGEDSTTFDVIERGGRPGGEPDPAFRLPAGFTPLPDAGYSESGLPLRIRCEKDDSVMVLVPAGTVTMGKDDGPSESTPELVVHLDDYYIDETEVTLEQYERFRREARQAGGRLRPEPLNASDPKEHPVLGLPWGEARAYANWAGKDLPTEAQWEKAARGPNGFDHPWGNGRAVWPRARSLDEIAPVQSFRTDRSPYGAFDLAGNAREWCLDWYSDRAFAEAAARGGTLRNWDGPRSASPPNQRVVKGNGPNWVVWHRAGRNMRERMPDMGFRCVLRVEGPGRR